MINNLNTNKINDTMDIQPVKLYGQIFTDWVEKHYRGVLPKLTIQKICDKTWIDNENKPVRTEIWEVFWKFEYNHSIGNTKTLRMICQYNQDGSIKFISFSSGMIDRGNSKSYIQTEKGLKISLRNIKKKILDNPKYRGIPSWCSDNDVWSSIF